MWTGRYVKQLDELWKWKFVRDTVECVADLKPIAACTTAGQLQCSAECIGPMCSEFVDCRIQASWTLCDDFLAHGMFDIDYLVKPPDIDYSIFE